MGIVPYAEIQRFLDEQAAQEEEDIATALKNQSPTAPKQESQEDQEPKTPG